MELLDIFQYGKFLYERTEQGIKRLNNHMFFYITEQGKNYILKNEGNIIDDNELDIYNNHVYKFYPNNLYTFQQRMKKIPSDYIFGLKDNVILYLKSNNLRYENDYSKYRIWYWDIETKFGENNEPENPVQPIISISIFDTILNKYFVISWHKDKTSHIPNKQYEVSNVIEDGDSITYIKVHDEYNLLRTFLLLLRKYKPILIVGWFSNFYDMPYLIKRLEINNIDTKYLSPIEQKIFMVPSNDNNYRIIIPGLYSLELNTIIEKYATTVRFPSMNLGKVAMQLGFNDKLKVNFIDDYENNYEYFLKYNINDVRLTKQINSAFGLIESLIYIHSASGIGFDDILMSAHIVEDALILYSKDRVIPIINREFKNYKGAIVLDPKYYGILHNLATLDANSMYPTSTITFNVSPETLICSYDDITNMFNEHKNFIEIKNMIEKKSNKTLENIEIKLDYNNNPIQYVKDLLIYNNIGYVDTLYDEELNEHGYLFFDYNYNPGIYPQFLMNVYNERINLKNQLKKVDKKSLKYHMLDVQQNALKIILNTVYGANGYVHFRLYDPRIAETITYFARKLLLYANDFLINKGYEIQYGDTDSLFVMLKSKDYNSCKNEANNLSNELNKSIYDNHTMKYINNNLPDILKNYLGFKLEHILRVIYFSDNKKRYYGIDYNNETYVRGMNVIRKDAPPLAKKILNDLIMKILDENISKSDFNNILDKIKKSSIPEIGIVKSFGKSLNSYDKTIPQHIRGVRFAEELLNIKMKDADKPYLLYIKPISDNILKNYKNFYNVICIRDDDIDKFLAQKDFIIDYVTFFKKQILQPLEEFKFFIKLKTVIDSLEYEYDYNDLQNKFNF